MHDQKRNARRRGLGDSSHFLMSLMSTPHLTGAVAPSGRALARAMAAAAGPPPEGLVVELGPGTGPVTRALLDRGLDPRRLVMVEYNPDFCRMLEDRFAGRAGDPGRRLRPAAHARRTSRASASRPSSPACRSSPGPPREREKLLGDAFALMGAEGVFVQFTYGPRVAHSARRSARAVTPPAAAGRSGPTCRRRGSGPTGSRRGPPALRAGRRRGGRTHEASRRPATG